MSVVESVRASLRHALLELQGPLRGRGPQPTAVGEGADAEPGVEAHWRGSQLGPGLDLLEQGTRLSLRRSARVRRGPIPDSVLALNERTRRRGGIAQISLAPGFSDTYLDQIHTPVALVPAPALSLTVVDERLLLWGDGAPDTGLLVLSDARAVRLAGRYLDDLVETSISVQPEWRRAGGSPTRRQTRIMSMLGQGATDDTMSRQLGVSSRTVRADVAVLADRFRVHSRAELLLAWTVWLQGG